MAKPSVAVKRALVVLLAMGALFSAALAVFTWYCGWSVRAARDAQARILPGDDLIPGPAGSVTHAITIRRAAHDVWPWLAQMGSGRAGWYAYDFIDNGGRPSAGRIVPGLQNVAAGTIFPALPGARDVFVVVRCDPYRSLVLAWRSPGGEYLTTWAFVLEQREPNRTRLIVRGRAGADYGPYGLPHWLAKAVAPWAHAIMERKQLLGIQRRAEAASWDSRK